MKALSALVAQQAEHWGFNPKIVWFDSRPEHLFYYKLRYLQLRLLHIQIILRWFFNKIRTDLIFFIFSYDLIEYRKPKYITQLMRGQLESLVAQLVEHRSDLAEGCVVQFPPRVFLLQHNKSTSMRLLMQICVIRDQFCIFLTQVDSIRVILVYIYLFIDSNLLAYCFNFINYSYREFRQFIVSDRESIIERLELPICAISFFNSFIFSICFDIYCLSFYLCSCSYFRLWTCLCLSTSYCYSFCTFIILLSIFTKRWESYEQILLTRLEKQVAVLSQMFLKNITAQKSSEKSWILPSGSSLCNIFTISYF